MLAGTGPEETRLLCAHPLFAAKTEEPFFLHVFGVELAMDSNKNIKIERSSGPVVGFSEGQLARRLACAGSKHE